MAVAVLYDPDRLARLTRRQIQMAWDIDKVIPPDATVDPSRYLVPLDNNALFFPGASAEQRLAISQWMGLVICACTCEMEESLLRLRESSWENIYRTIPVSKEFIALGDQFFEEEKKHSEAFRRYMDKFCAALGLDSTELSSILPRVQGNPIENILKRNLDNYGCAYWWIVAIVEQQFLSIYHSIEPSKNQIDPLYFHLHKSHFEEEALHLPFPFLMIDLLTAHAPTMKRLVHQKLDFAYAHMLEMVWAVSAIKRIENVKNLKDVHPFYAVLNSALPLIKKRTWKETFLGMFTSVPYVSGLLNPAASKAVLTHARKKESFVLPFPKYKPSALFVDGSGL